MQASIVNRWAFSTRPAVGAKRCSPQIVTRQRCRQHSVVVRAETNGLLERFLGVFGRSSEGPDSGASRKKLRSASAELVQLLCYTDAPDLSRVNDLLDELISAEGQPFSEKSLGGGPWVVRFSRGQPFLWNLTYNASRQINSKNRASQDFDPAYRSATNMVEINGPDSFVAVYGTYEPVDDSAVTPKTVRARINSGRLVAWGLELPLPISGTGLFDVMYVDESLRVFRSSGRFAVQVRADRLPERD